MGKQRVVCLYRVSTKKQLDKQETIEMQKNACMDYVKKNPDWEIIKEYSERGVSGYKVSQEDREVLQQIKSDAANKAFDILLVFMFDRIGRKEDESPYVINFLNKQGVRVFSVKEGEMKSSNHIDKLLNNITFWQSSGESEKISIRTDEKLEQISKEGKFTGGPAPYGYDLILSGNLNKKGKEINKRVINEDEAEIVREIFRFSSELGYGKERIAKHLNKQLIKSKNGLQWNAGTVGYILKNPIYKGFPAYRKKSNKTRHQINKPKEEWCYAEKQQKDLVIVSESVWEKAQKVIENHIKPLDKCSDKMTKSPLLFVGIIKCADCGSPLTTTYSYKYNKDKTKTYVIPKYRCSGKVVKNVPCKGQTVYSGSKVDNAVLRAVYDYLSKFNSENITDTLQQRNKDKIKKDLKKVQIEIQTQENRISKLQNEIPKCLIGDSHFTQADLSISLKNCNSEIESLKAKESDIKEKLATFLSAQESAKAIIDIVKDWDYWIKTINHDKLKYLLRLLISKIELSNDEINIEYNDDMNSFLSNAKKGQLI